MREGWEIKKLIEICENLDSKRIPITKSKRISGNIPYYGASGIVDYVKDFLFDENLLLISEDGANLLARTYPIAFSISGKTWVNNHAHVLRFEESTTQKFVEYYFNSIKLNAFVSGMAQPKLNQKSLNSIPIPIPPLEEQKQIVAILDKTFTTIDQAKANIEKNIANAKELFQSKLNDIFSRKGDGWEEKTLGEVCEKTKNIKWQDYPNSEFEYVDLSSLSRETLSVTETVTVNKENAPSRAKKIILEGDVIFATTRPTLKRATIIDEELSDNLCSTGYVVLRPKENISSDWIFFYLLTTKFMDRMESLQRGASYPAVSDNDVKGSKLSVPMSKVEEKQNIIIMKNLQENTNLLINNYINKLHDLEDLKKSILQKAFAGELTSTSSTTTKKEVLV